MNQMATNDVSVFENQGAESVSIKGYLEFQSLNCFALMFLVYVPLEEYETFSEF